MPQFQIPAEGASHQGLVLQTWQWCCCVPITSGCLSICLSACISACYAWSPQGNAAYSTPRFLCDVGVLDAWPQRCNFPASLVLPAPPTVDAVDLPGFCSCSPPSVSMTEGFFHISCKRFPLLTSASCFAHSTTSVESWDQWKGLFHMEPPTFAFWPSDTICRSLLCSCCPLLNANRRLYSAAAVLPHKGGEGQRSVIPDNVDNVSRKVSTRLITARLLHRMDEQIRLIWNRCRSIRQSGVCPLITAPSELTPLGSTAPSSWSLPGGRGAAEVLMPAAFTKSGWKLSISQSPLHLLSEIPTEISPLQTWIFMQTTKRTLFQIEYIRLQHKRWDIYKERKLKRIYAGSK